jgi:2-polyprenyl-6-methoxyphenol hydroxylase-like FAD-dependent oxidoreductase
MRDGGQSNDASAGDGTTGASRIAARATLPLTLSMLLLAGCGGSSQPGFRDPERLAVGVRRSVEQRLMRQAPRQDSAHTATHLERVRCEHVAGDRYVCRGVRGDGSKLHVDVVVSADGRRFRIR